MLFVFSCVLLAKPLQIIIVTNNNDSEAGYSEFLREIYMDNADVEVDDDRYKEPLSDSEKLQLTEAELIIVSSDGTGGDYNYDSAFWATLAVPVLSHNTSICRSNSQDNWDWFSSDKVTKPVSEFYASDVNDPVFDGIDISSGSITIFDSPLDFILPDQSYSGSGTEVAVDANGLPVIFRFDGSEENYYDGSLYGPNGAPRLFFAMPAEPVIFFDNATESAKQLLRNAITSLLPECWLTGDIDCDRDVDVGDLSEMSAQWLDESPLEGEPLAADIVPSGRVDMFDFSLLSMFWNEGLDSNPPVPNPSEWKDEPAMVDGEILFMKAKNTTDDFHGVQYFFDCIENPALSSVWQYSREYTPTNLPTGVDISFQVKARDTSSALNETTSSAIRSVRTDGLFYYSSDASAAVALDSQRFIMADDEDNILRVYCWNLPSSDPNAETDVSSAIAIDPSQPEGDIEGATWYNNRVFWITSHGRSRYGDYWPSRYRFFATTVGPDGTAAVDGVYSGLIDALIQYDRTWNLGLEAAIGTVGDHIDPDTIADLAPKKNGLNIEGLCTTADGSKMLIGFRNPRPLDNSENMALVIPLANPEAVVLTAADPNFEAPYLIDLNGLGIRSIEYSSSVGEYLIVAGSHQGGNDEPVQFLYNYDFDLQDRDKLATFSNITPEAVFQFPGSANINLLSDDGTVMIDVPGEPNSIMNKLLPREQRRYRTRVVKP